MVRIHGDAEKAVRLAAFNRTWERTFHIGQTGPFTPGSGDVTSSVAAIMEAPYFPGAEDGVRLLCESVNIEPYITYLCKWQNHQPHREPYNYPAMCAAVKMELNIVDPHTVLLFGRHAVGVWFTEATTPTGTTWVKDGRMVMPMDRVVSGTPHPRMYGQIEQLAPVLGFHKAREREPRPLLKRKRPLLKRMSS